jgi:hypothetical protein
MTEAEWLASTNPRGMVAFLRGQSDDRKLLLFGCACCRLTLVHKFQRGLLQWVEMTEEWVDKRAGTEAQRPEDLWSYLGPGLFVDDPTDNHIMTDEVTRGVPLGRGFQKVRRVPIKELVTKDALIPLLRDIFGNPFRPLPPRPEAITPLAEEIYAGRWELMPLLGEWLQEHGFGPAGEHCLDPGITHVKGCWVVDWLLGKE